MHEPALRFNFHKFLLQLLPEVYSIREPFIVWPNTLENGSKGLRSLSGIIISNYPIANTVTGLYGCLKRFSRSNYTISNTYSRIPDQTGCYCNVFVTGRHYIPQSVNIIPELGATDLEVDKTINLTGAILYPDRQTVNRPAIIDQWQKNLHLCH